MQVGFYTWGSCFVEHPGLDGPDPYSRHHSAADYERTYAALLDWARLADDLGYDAFWLTEHHAQREGYEVIPNVILLASVFAQHTRHIKFGSFFHVVPTWHPLRMAEDFALADILTGGRLLFGAGRGSVEREALLFGAGFGRGGDHGDKRNRELFEEQMQVMKLAWNEREFSFHGEHYRLPPPSVLNTGEPSTGRPWERMSLVPQPTHPLRIYQAVLSDETYHYVAREGHVGVVPLFGGLDRTRVRWEYFGELSARYQGRAFRPGENRLLVVSIHMGRDRASAIDEVRPALTERYRFLAQQRSVGAAPDGTPYPVGHVPSIEEVVDGGGVLVGSPGEIADRLAELVATLGVEELAVEMGYPGMLESDVASQIRLFADEVRPVLERSAPAAVPVVA